jgi:hypothetical protein
VLIKAIELLLIGFLRSSHGSGAVPDIEGLGTHYGA